MPLWLFSCDGRASSPGQGSALGRTITTGERALTGETFLTEKSTIRGAAIDYGEYLAHWRLSVLFIGRNKCRHLRY
jgi:hypothetical protein